MVDTAMTLAKAFVGLFGPGGPFQHLIVIAVVRAMAKNQIGVRPMQKVKLGS